MLIAILVAAVCAVAFTNGANANSKGVASLYGSGTTTRGRALAWGTATTFAGSVAAAFLAPGLVRAFSGRGIVPDAVVGTPEFVAAVAIGAAGTCFIATRCGMPVSTTHGLVGGLLGAGWAGGGGVHIAALGRTFVFPLLFSPAVAFCLGGLAALLFAAVGRTGDGRTRGLDTAHALSTGAASFARGLNDTPKMAALLLAVPAVTPEWAAVAVAGLIALGGLLDADRVAETLGKKVTAMNPRQGFAASVVTAALVATASLHGLPVSTTHVSVGSLLGMGALTRQARWRSVGEIAIAWLVTLPCAAVLAAVAHATVRSLR